MTVDARPNEAIDVRQLMSRLCVLTDRVVDLLHRVEAAIHSGDKTASHDFQGLDLSIQILEDVGRMAAIVASGDSPMPVHDAQRLAQALKLETTRAQFLGPPVSRNGSIDGSIELF